MNFKILFSFLKTYKINFILLTLSLSVSFFLIVYLLNMFKYKDYYMEYKFGIVPQEIVLSPKGEPLEVAPEVLQGNYKCIEKITFRDSANDLSYIVKDVFVFGFDFSKELKITIKNGQDQKDLKVLKIYSTNKTKWKIKTQPLGDLKGDKKDLQITFAGHTSAISLKRDRSRYAIFEFSPQKHNSEEFYNILIEIVKYYMHTFHLSRQSTLDMDTNNKQDIYTTRYKKTLENYFSLMFGSRVAKSLSSVYLSNQISNFKHVSQHYSIGVDNTQIKMIIRDVVNFPIDKNSKHIELSNILFVNMDTLKKFPQAQEEGKFAFLYDNHVQKHHSTNIYITKQELLLNLMGNDLVEKLLLSSIGMITLFIFVILVIALIRFYNLFAKDIYLMKIYSSKNLIFTQIVFLMAIVATFFAYFALARSFQVVNEIFVQYYQTIIYFDISYLWGVFFSFLVLVVLILLFEHILWRRLWVSIK